MQSASDAAEGGYAKLQILLHWAVALLVAAQWLSAGAMEAFFDRNENGPPGFPDSGGAILHALGGGTILMLMLARIAARLRYGAPPLPADMSPALKLVAHLDHLALYATLILLPATGALALYIVTDAADLHKLLKTLLLALVALHVAGALFHAVIRGDGVLWRMLSPRGRP